MIGQRAAGPKKTVLWVVLVDRALTHSIEGLSTLRRLEIQTARKAFVTPWTLYNYTNCVLGPDIRSKCIPKPCVALNRFILRTLDMFLFRLPLVSFDLGVYITRLADHYLYVGPGCWPLLLPVMSASRYLGAYSCMKRQPLCIHSGYLVIDTKNDTGIVYDDWNCTNIGCHLGVVQRLISAR